MPDLVTQFPRNQQLSAAQPDLQFNYQTINTIWGVNHIDLLAGANNGMHTIVDLLPQLMPQAGVAGQLQLVNIMDQETGDLVLNLVREASVIPWINEGTIVGTQSAFLAYKLPSGIIFKFYYGPLPIIELSGINITKWSSLSSLGTTDIPFTNQYVVAMWPSGIGNGQDDGTAVYVTDITNPLQFTFNAWRRSGTPGRVAVGNILMTIIAIGS
jgi:hypothetical protein